MKWGGASLVELRRGARERLGDPFLLADVGDRPRHEEEHHDAENRDEERGRPDPLDPRAREDEVDEHEAGDECGCEQSRVRRHQEAQPIGRARHQGTSDRSPLAEAEQRVEQQDQNPAVGKRDMAGDGALVHPGVEGDEQRAEEARQEPEPAAVEQEEHRHPCEEQADEEEGVDGARDAEHVLREPHEARLDRGGDLHGSEDRIALRSPVGGVVAVGEGVRSRLVDHVVEAHRHRGVAEVREHPRVRMGEDRAEEQRADSGKNSRRSERTHHRPRAERYCAIQARTSPCREGFRHGGRS